MTGQHNRRGDDGQKRAATPVATRRWLLSTAARVVPYRMTTLAAAAMLLGALGAPGAAFAQGGTIGAKTTP